MTNVAAAIGVAQIERIDWHLGRRREVAGWYRQRLEALPGVTFSPELEWARNAYWMSCVVLEDTIAASARRDRRPARRGGCRDAAVLLPAAHAAALSRARRSVPGRRAAGSPRPEPPLLGAAHRRRRRLRVRGARRCRRGLSPANAALDDGDRPAARLRGRLDPLARGPWKRSCHARRRTLPPHSARSDPRARSGSEPHRHGLARPLDEHGRLGRPAPCGRSVSRSRGARRSRRPRRRAPRAPAAGRGRARRPARRPRAWPRAAQRRAVRLRGRRRVGSRHEGHLAHRARHSRGRALRGAPRQPSRMGGLSGPRCTATTGPACAERGRGGARGDWSRADLLRAQLRRLRAAAAQHLALRSAAGCVAPGLGDRLPVRGLRGDAHARGRRRSRESRRARPGAARGALHGRGRDRAGYGARDPSCAGLGRPRQHLPRAPARPRLRRAARHGHRGSRCVEIERTADRARRGRRMPARALLGRAGRRLLRLARRSVVHGRAGPRPHARDDRRLGVRDPAPVPAAELRAAVGAQADRRGRFAPRSCSPSSASAWRAVGRRPGRSSAFRRSRSRSPQ